MTTSERAGGAGDPNVCDPNVFEARGCARGVRGRGTGRGRGRGTRRARALDRARVRSMAGGAALVLAVLGLGGPVAGQDAPAALVGTVTTAEGAPLEGTTVRLSGSVERGVVTGASGRFVLAGLPAGRYGLRVELLGYRVVEREVTLAAGSTEEVTVALSPSPLGLESVRVVTTTRASRNASTVPAKINVLEAEELAPQRSLVTNPTELVSNLVPSFSPGRQKLTSSGESFRGRRPLYLIDGVPQSNPLRDGRRDGFTIGLEAVERVEVVFGANAIQGLGATGGIINFITVSPARAGELEQRVTVGATSSGGLESEGLGWSGHYLAAKRVGAFDVLGSFTYERQGLQYDGEGRPIALDNVQGDVADSESRSLFAKVGWEPAESQRLQLMVSDFRLAQRGNYEMVPGDRAAGIPAVAVEGSPEGVEPINDVTTASLDWEHRDLLGGIVSAKAYWQDFASLFGGGRFATFQDPAIAPVGELFDQSENNSEKLGTRLTYARAAGGGVPVGVVAGFDFLRDRTFQRLVQTDRNWVPETRFLNWAPFAQLDWQPVRALTVTGGVRWELARLDVPGFLTLAANSDTYEPILVEGGRPSFDAPLANVGAVLTPVPGLRFYGTWSQGFTMPDVGRVLRGVSEEGTAVEDFLALDPIETDNLEVGGAWGTTVSHVGVTWFRSDSEFGLRLVPNADGIFQVMREPTRTSGWEVTGRLLPHERVSLAAGYALLEGEYDGDGDGEVESDLGAADIGPDRLNLSADLEATDRLSGRVQAFRYFDRTFRDGTGETTASFDGYTTVDASVTADLGRATVSLSAANLLDTHYISYFGQAATTLADRYFAGRGRTFAVRVETRF